MFRWYVLLNLRSAQKGGVTARTSWIHRCSKPPAKEEGAEVDVLAAKEEGAEVDVLAEDFKGLAVVEEGEEDEEPKETDEFLDCDYDDTIPEWW